MSDMMQKEKNVNPAIVARFAQMIAHNRLAHAYLFIGPHETGKSSTALSVARLVNCERNEDGALKKGCGLCASCRKIFSGNHPDVRLIEAGEETSIKIEVVREMISRMQLKPFEGRKKVYIIRDIEKMTLEGSNCMLKTLEEPTDSSLLILTTSVPEKNLDTVKSRCHQMVFFPLAQWDVEQQLVEHSGVSARAARFISFFCEGSLGKARKLSEEAFFTKKNDIIDNAVLTYDNEDYLKSIAADKDKAKGMLDVVLSWFRDLMLLKTGVGEDRLMHADRKKELINAFNHYTFEELDSIMYEIINTSRQLSENLNVKIPLGILKEKIWAKSFK